MARRRTSIHVSDQITSLTETPPQRNMELLSWYDRQVLERIAEHGGVRNRHGHFDRAYTLRPQYLQHLEITPLEASKLPLSAKQNLVGDLHRGPAYKEDDFRGRMTYAFRLQKAYGVTHIDTNIDATPDLPEGGLLAIRVALELKEQFVKEGVTIRVAPTPIFGLFKSDSKHKRTRLEVFKEAAGMCDYLSLLPEKDGSANSTDEDEEIRFKRHIRTGLELGCELGKEVQFHLDQMNVPEEAGTEYLLDVLKVVDQPKLGSEPSVWVIHMISPSAYSEDRFARLLDRLLRHNVGVIVCPSAALSMRQLRSLDGPIHNSIARILELIKAGVPIRMGTDNIEDVFVPQGDGDMLTEIKIAGHAVRMAAPSIWAKLATGTPLTKVDIATVGGILYQDRLACGKIGTPDWKAAVK